MPPSPAARPARQTPLRSPARSWHAGVAQATIPGHACVSFTVKPAACALTLAVFVSAAVACGEPHPVPAASSTSAPGPGTSAGGPGTARQCAARVVARQPAGGSTVCVTVGGELTVLLPIRAGTNWSQPQVTGSGLSPARPIFTPYLTSGWSFGALRAGTAEITTSRPVCPPATPGRVSCDSVIVFSLRVKVRKCRLRMSGPASAAGPAGPDTAVTLASARP